MSCEYVDDNVLAPGSVKGLEEESDAGAICALYGSWYGDSEKNAFASNAGSCKAAEKCTEVDFTSRTTIPEAFKFDSAFCKTLHHEGGPVKEDGVQCEFTDGDKTCSGSLSIFLGSALALIIAIF